MLAGSAYAIKRNFLLISSAWSSSSNAVAFRKIICILFAWWTLGLEKNPLGSNKVIKGWYPWRNDVIFRGIVHIWIRTITPLPGRCVKYLLMVNIEGQTYVACWIVERRTRWRRSEYYTICSQSKNRFQKDRCNRRKSEYKYAWSEPSPAFGRISLMKLDWEQNIYNWRQSQCTGTWILKKCIDKQHLNIDWQWE